jgi:hypothetical protein
MRFPALAALALIAAPAAAQTVPLPHFDSIELSYGGRILLRQGPVQRVTLVRGSTEYTSFRVERRGMQQKLVVVTCNARCPQRYDMDVVVEGPDVEALAVHNGGLIVADGPFPLRPEMSVAVTHGGEIDLARMPVREVSAAVQGGGGITVDARDSLAAAVHGGGEIVYLGSPSLAQAVEGGGTIRRRR